MTTETKKITVRELQTFIEAVEFAADSDNWIPSERQWKRIRQMIDNLVVETHTTKPAVQTQPAAPTYVPATAYVQPDRPVAMSPGGLTGHRPAPTPAPSFAASPGLPVKTPDIDTSTGPYNSGFA